jgi:hypothetical protein
MFSADLSWTDTSKETVRQRRQRKESNVQSLSGISRSSISCEYNEQIRTSQPWMRGYNYSKASSSIVAVSKKKGGDRSTAFQGPTSPTTTKTLRLWQINRRPTTDTIPIDDSGTVRSKTSSEGIFQQSKA